MIDPLEVVIATARQDGGLNAIVGTRIAAKRLYGLAGGWTNGLPALVLRLNGGGTKAYIPVQTVNIEARCFGSTQMEAMTIYDRLVEIARGTDRHLVTTSGGQGLIYSFLPSAGPNTLYDPDMLMDFVLGFFDAWVAEGVMA